MPIYSAAFFCDLAYAHDRNHAELVGKPAVERDPEQLPLHQQRRVAEQRNEGEGLPG